MPIPTTALRTPIYSTTPRREAPRQPIMGLQSVRRSASASPRASPPPAAPAPARLARRVPRGSAKQPVCRSTDPTCVAYDNSRCLLRLPKDDLFFINSTSSRILTAGQFEDALIPPYTFLVTVCSDILEVHILKTAINIIIYSLLLLVLFTGTTTRIRNTLQEY